MRTHRRAQMFTLIINAIIAQISKTHEVEKLKPVFEGGRRAAFTNEIQKILDRVRSPEDVHDLMNEALAARDEVQKLKIEAIKAKDLHRYKALRGKEDGLLELAGIYFNGILKMTDLDTECEDCHDWLTADEVNEDGHCGMCADDAAEMARR